MERRKLIWVRMLSGLVCRHGEGALAKELIGNTTHIQPQRGGDRAVSVLGQPHTGLSEHPPLPQSNLVGWDLLTVSCPSRPCPSYVANLHPL